MPRQCQTGNESLGESRRAEDLLSILGGQKGWLLGSVTDEKCKEMKSPAGRGGRGREFQTAASPLDHIIWAAFQVFYTLGGGLPSSVNPSR